MGRGWVMFAAVLVCGLSPAMAAQEDWEPDLTWQLEQEQNCNVRFLTNVIERMVNEAESVFARAHCDDGRAYDAVREDAFSRFTFEPCKLDIKTC